MVMVESNQIVVDNVSSSSRFEAFCNEYKQCYLLTLVISKGMLVVDY